MVWINNLMTAYSRQNLTLLGAVTLAFVTFCVETDIYAPSFPDMMSHFATNESTIQYILTANFIGLFLSTLVFGPLSDSYGRKPALSAGLVLFALSSVFCMWVGAIEQLIIWRFFQGIGAGAITGVGTAMVLDTFPKDTSARLIAVLNSIVTGMMASAPLIGSWVNILWGWRMNFAIIAVLALLSLFVTVGLVKETLPAQKRTPLSVRGILLEYWAMLSNPTFMRNTLMWSLMFSLLMVFVANLSLVYIEYWKVPEALFGLYQTAIMATFFVASLITAQMIAYCGMEKTKHWGNAFFAIGVVGVAVLAITERVLPIPLTISMCFCSAGVALSCTIYYVDGLKDFPNAAGTLGALSQAVRLFISAAMVAIASALFTGSMQPVGYMTAVVALLLIVFYPRGNAVKLALETDNV